MRTTVVIVAAGAGTRLAVGRPKAAVTLGDGRTLLDRSLDAVITAARTGADRQGRAGLELAAVVVVVPPDARAAGPLVSACTQRAEDTGLVIRTVAGGAERADSVRAGLQVAADLAAGPPGDEPAPVRARQAVLVHDAARPFVPPVVFHAVVEALAAGASAVVPAVPVTDTIKAVGPWSDAEGLVGTEPTPTPERVTATVDRGRLRAVQTPQGFDLQALLAAHRLAAEQAGYRAAAMTDDAMLMESAGHRVGVVPGDARSFKITTAFDLQVAETLVREEPR